MTTFATMLNGKSEKIAAMSVTMTARRRIDTGAMVHELYRDKILSTFQAKEILLGLGFTVVIDSRTNELVSYK
jgi:hypothetical protein